MQGYSSGDISAPESIELQVWPEPQLPERPYPVLLPYEHPDLLAGRDRELAEVRAVLEHDVPLTGVYSPSGVGKSSFLFAGLICGLRREARPAAYDRYPCEPRIASRLLKNLVREDIEVDESDPRLFVAILGAVRKLAGKPPILVIDQFEDVLRRPGCERARTVLGLLLAASAGRDDPPCRWILAYRREFHGQVTHWLSDVLQFVDTDGTTIGKTLAGGLPRDFSGPERFQSFPLTPLGAPAPGTDSTIEAATEVFREVIAKPLAASRYAWRFSAHGLDRLARAFGETRQRRSEAPLVPELQVVLAHLLESCGNIESGDTLEVHVPDDVESLIEQALEDHLRRALDAAFPISGKQARTLRTRAILALRELADAEGQRGEALTPVVLARAIGEEGADVLEQMATASTRLVTPVRIEGELCYALAHDRLAEVLVRLVDRRQFQGLGIDRELLELRRFTALRSALFAEGETASATEVPATHFVRIREHHEALLWGEERKRWWQACRERYRMKRRRARLRIAIGALLLAAVSLGTWFEVDRRERLAALFEEVALGEPGPAFVAARTLLVEWQREPEEIRQQLRIRDEPMDVLDRGISEVVGESREAAVSRIAETALPLITEDAPEDSVRIASLVWALDFFALKEEPTREMRHLALAALRAKHPPPPLPQAGDPLWADIPAGTFWMGAGPEEGRDDPNMMDEYPRHQVKISAFRMGIYEVTNAEFRRLFPQHAAGQDDRLPAADLTWSQAYTYAAWLGGRLPTEAEAEYVRRGGCDFKHCDRNGRETTLDVVARWRGNALVPETGDLARQPVGRLEPNPWGLYDLYGNVLELCADWYGGNYTAAEQSDPPGRAVPTLNGRIARGGSAWDQKEFIEPSSRSILTLGNGWDAYGLRVVLRLPPGNNQRDSADGSATRKP